MWASVSPPECAADKTPVLGCGQGLDVSSVLSQDWMQGRSCCCSWWWEAYLTTGSAPANWAPAMCLARSQLFLWTITQQCSEVGAQCLCHHLRRRKGNFAEGKQPALGVWTGAVGPQAPVLPHSGLPPTPLPLRVLLPLFFGVRPESGIGPWCLLLSRGALPHAKAPLCARPCLHPPLGSLVREASR